MGLSPEVAMYKLRRADGWRMRAVRKYVGNCAPLDTFETLAGHETDIFNRDAIDQLRRTAEASG
jgi:hypothetical protein